MNKKHIFIAALPAFLLLFFGFLFATSGVFKQAKATAKPNIVVFMTDDQTLESMRVMPIVKSKLTDRGVSFDNYITSNSLCCPSRATYFTGQYAQNNGVYGNFAPNGGYSSLIDKETIMPVVLKNAGYTTIQIGKYLNGYGETNPASVPQGWSQWHATTTQGFNGYYNYQINNNGVLRQYGSAPSDYLNDVLKNIALEQVTLAKDTQRPFYMNLAFFAPHYNPVGLDAEPPIPAPRHMGLFTNEQLPNIPSYNETDVSDKPAHIRSHFAGEPAYKLNNTSVTSNYRKELASLQAVDEAIGSVISKIEEYGMADNTVFIFVSDNGYYHGEHRLSSKKYLPYEEGIHLPLIIKAPGVNMGTISNEVGNIDLAPTILDFAGLSSLRLMDGHSLKPLLLGEQASWNRPMLIQGDKGTAKHPSFTGVRTDRYKYILYQTGESELYDLQTDPYELQSRHNDPSYAAIKAELVTKLNNLKNCKGRQCDVAPYGFSDVPETMSAINAIVWTARSGISNWFANNKFKPNTYITRGEMASWLYKMNGSPSIQPPHGFTDVPTNSPDEQAIRWLKAQGISNGFSGNIFKPTDPLKRKQLSEWLWKLNSSPTASPQNGFTDVAQTSQYNQPINWIIDRNIDEGFSDNTFRPNDNLQRKKAAAWLWNSQNKPSP